MPVTEFLVVVVAAFAHATWNFFAKRAAASEHLIWFSSVTEAVFFAPVLGWILTHAWPSLGLMSALLLLATGVMHLLYMESLLRGYRVVALLSPVGYILVLFAMRLAPVSHIAPVREMSMMIGVFYGARFSSEGSLLRRVVGSALIAGGVTALAMG